MLPVFDLKNSNKRRKSSFDVHETCLSSPSETKTTRRGVESVGNVITRYVGGF